MIWEPLQQEPAFRALDAAGQRRAVEVFGHLIRSSMLTAPIRAYVPPPGTAGSEAGRAANLARRLRAAQERVARLRGETRELPVPGTLPGMAGLQPGEALDWESAKVTEALRKPLDERQGMTEALLALPTQRADPPRAAPPAPEPRPEPALPPPDRVARAAPRHQPVAAGPVPGAPLDRPTLGGAGVTVQPAGEGAWEGIAAGALQPVPWGTVVRTSRRDRGRVVLPGNRGTVHLEPSTEVKLVPGWVRLVRGELRLQVPAEGSSAMEVRTPKGRLEVGPGGDARVRPGGFARVKDPVRRAG